MWCFIVTFILYNYITEQNFHVWSGFCHLFQSTCGLEIFKQNQYLGYFAVIHWDPVHVGYFCVWVGQIIVQEVFVASLLVLGFVVDVGEAALPAVLPIEVGGHEDTGTTLLAGALTSETGDLTILIDLKKQRQDSKFGVIFLNKNW